MREEAYVPWYIWRPIITHLLLHITRFHCCFIIANQGPNIRTSVLKSHLRLETKSIALELDLDSILQEYGFLTMLPSGDLLNFGNSGSNN